MEEVIRQAFTEAREYKKQWDDYNQRKAAGEQQINSAAAQRADWSRWWKCWKESVTSTCTAIARMKF